LVAARTLPSTPIVMIEVFYLFNCGRCAGAWRVSLWATSGSSAG
jgi:hypothetical protein